MKRMHGFELDLMGLVKDDNTYAGQEVGYYIIQPIVLTANEVSR